MAAVVSSYPQSMGTSYHHFSLDRKRVEGRSKRGRVKTVTWMPDSQICQVRQFQSADAPMKLGPIEHGILRQNTTSAHEVMDLPPGFGGHMAKQARVEIYMPVQLRWGPPPKFIIRDDWMVARGDESLEVRFQNDRELRMLEAIYPRMTSIPDSPAEPDACFTSVDDHVPLIPIEEYDDNESTHNSNDCEEFTSESSRLTEPTLGEIKQINFQHVQQQSCLGDNNHTNQNHDQNNLPKVESRNNESFQGNTAEGFYFVGNLNIVPETRKGPVIHQEPLESMPRTSKTSQPQNTKSLCEHIAAAAAAASSEFRAKGIAQRGDTLVEYSRMSFVNQRKEPAGLNKGNVSQGFQMQNCHVKPTFDSVNRFHDGRHFNSLASSALDTPPNGVEAPFIRTSRITVADANHHYPNANNSVPLQHQSKFSESYRPQQQTNFYQVERPIAASEMRPWGHETFQIHNTTTRAPLDSYERPSIHSDVSRCERVPFASLSHPNAYQSPVPQMVPANLNSSQPTFGGSSGRDLRFNKPSQSDNKNVANVAPKSARGKKVCIYFNTLRGCLRGGNCAFLHQSNDAVVNTMAQ